ncbi:flagellar biosynthesis protein FlgA [Pengzhenrongella frigida]|uniref:Flagellar biosynthesis protein FlgA n=1 Tax=Pengzhenrongella frigida TaxID=1259133 RepID=A0A4Q5MXM8_9MICO|nr:flagellar biosynthesis protein FlgA [Cellulomonas sp. HLT2-17]
MLAWRVRFPVAAALLALAATLVIAELRPAPAVTVPVAVAGRELAPGVPLAAADLRVVRMPPALVPSGAHPSVDTVVGQRLVVGAPAGLPIVHGLLAGDRLATAGPAGTVVAPVRLADPAVAALLRPGDRIDLLAAAGTADGEPAVHQLATRAIVLADPGSDSASAGASAGQDAGAGAIGGLLGGGADPGTGALTLVAVTPAEAAALAGAVGWANLSAVVVE